MFKEVLGAESIMMGFCDPNCNAHGPNEFFGLEDLHKGIRAAARFLEKMAKGWFVSSRRAAPFLAPRRRRRG